MATKTQTRIKAIALELACSAIAKELQNPSELADGILDFNPDVDIPAVYAALEDVYIQLKHKSDKATESYRRFSA